MNHYIRVRGYPTLFHRQNLLKKMLRKDKYWHNQLRTLTKLIEKSFLINPLTTISAIYCDSLTLIKNDVPII